jgi:hypothetical protein
MKIIDAKIVKFEIVRFSDVSNENIGCGVQGIGCWVSHGCRELLDKGCRV